MTTIVMNRNNPFMKAVGDLRTDFYEASKFVPEYQRADLLLPEQGNNVYADRNCFENRNMNKRHPLIMNNKPLILNNKPLIMNNKPLIMNNKPLIMNNKPLIMNNKPLIMEDNKTLILEETNRHNCTEDSYDHDKTLIIKARRYIDEIICMILGRQTQCVTRSWEEILVDIIDLETPYRRYGRDSMTTIIQSVLGRDQGSVVVMPQMPYNTQMSMKTPFCRVAIIGTLYTNASNFSVDLKVGADSAFSMDTRVKQALVLRNASHGGKWGYEERNRQAVVFPFVQGKSFYMEMIIKDTGYTINVNGKHFISFTSRHNMMKMDRLIVTGDLSLQMVTILN